jgi:hypothetical protein
MGRRGARLALLLACALAAAAVRCAAGARIYDLSVADAAGGAVTVAASADAAGGAAVASLTLRFRVNYGAEQSANMTRAGCGAAPGRSRLGTTDAPGCSLAARLLTRLLLTAAAAHARSGARWTATLAGLPAGALLRASASAWDAGGAALGAADAPPAVIAAAAVAAESRLPTLHWFVADPEAARGDAPTPSDVFIDAGDGAGLRYHGNVTTHRTGSERKDPKANLWAKGKSKARPRADDACAALMPRSRAAA